jgi:hypothetical protein
MTHEKASELFSAYSEGTLDAGLSRALSQQLATDSELAKEYSRFQATLTLLDGLQYEPIAIPDDLSERISARLDKHIWDAKQKTTPAWQSWLRGIAFAGAAAAIIFGSVVSLTHRSSGSVASSMVGASGSGDHVTLVKTDSAVRLKFSPSTAKTLSVFSEPDHKIVTVLRVNGYVDAPLVNPNSEVGLLRIEVEGAKESTVVALPGAVRDFKTIQAARTSKVKGTIEQLAAALATVYSVPVELQVSDPQATVNWNFKELDARSAGSKALEGQPYSVDLRDSGFICIQNN